MAAHGNPDLINNGLTFCIDALDKNSYIGSGTTWTDLAIPKNGTVTNGPVFSSDGYFTFDGTNDQIIFGDLGIGDAYHFGVWFYLESSVNSSTSSYGLFRYQNIDLAGVNFGSFTSYATNETLTISYTVDSGGYFGGDPSYKTYIRDNFAAGWHYLSLNWNSNKYDIYVNADSKTTYASTHSDAINNPLSGTAAGHVPLMTMDQFKLGFGAVYNQMSILDGRIASVHMYNRSLTTTEITHNFNSQRDRFGV